MLIHVQVVLMAITKMKLDNAKNVHQSVKRVLEILITVGNAYKELVDL